MVIGVSVVVAVVALMALSSDGADTGTSDDRTASGASAQGVEVDASDTGMCMYGSVQAKNVSGAPVTVAVDIGVYKDGELLDFRTGSWDAPTNFDGWLDGLDEWPATVWNMGDHRGLSCRVRDVQVTERG